MTLCKDVLCLLAILLACGIAGHFDREHEASMDRALHEGAQPPCSAPAGVATSPENREPVAGGLQSIASAASAPRPACGLVRP